MQTEENVSSSERRCPSCGAVMSAGVRFCGACGMEWTPAATPSAEEPASSATSAAIAPEAAESSLAEASVAPMAAAEASSAALATPTTQPTDGRVCPWCGAVNALDGGPRCVSCGAVFPTPEGDEALERAARARIQSMESDLKPVRSGWWPFRGRQGEGV